MNNNLSDKISESYKDIEKIHDDINNKIFNFIIKANELVDLSEDMYQIEKTIELNKISLKGYILESPCCKMLEENNVSNYSLEELKKYLLNYEQTSNDDCSSCYLAISLYELLELIEKTVDNKVELEINKLSQLVPSISDIKNTDSNSYENFYNRIKNDLKNNYLNQNLIDDKSFDICLKIINDIFNYYISGYPHIPEEYLYHNKS